jgi:hypothetical protein
VLCVRESKLKSDLDSNGACMPYTLGLEPVVRLDLILSVELFPIEPPLVKP